MPLQKKIAILGGGQLGQMFIQNAISYGVDVAVLDPSENCSCAGLASSFTKGSFKDYDTVLEFGRKADIITIEIEHVNTDALYQLEKEGKTVIPSARAIEIIKDKGLQKEFYAKKRIPSSDFVLVNSASEIEQYLDKFPFFQKARKEGYDGKGVVKLKDENSLDKAFDCPSVLESLVDIEKELSVIVVRSQAGEMQVFPVVELMFDAVYNLVDYLKIPAEIDDSQLQEANDLAMQVVAGLGSAGVFAVELFLTKEGKILVNETAPRAHNSGHHSIEASISSQFDQQLRVLLDLPIGSTKSYKAAAMINIVGSEGHIGKAKYEGIKEVLAMENVYIHLYGKEETRSGRKMGHVTVIGFSGEEIRPKIDEIKAKLRVVAQ